MLGDYHQLWEDGTFPGALPNTIVRLPELHTQPVSSQVSNS